MFLDNDENEFNHVMSRMCTTKTLIYLSQSCHMMQYYASKFVS
jgi:hypothetical protein